MITHYVGESVGEQALPSIAGSNVNCFNVHGGKFGNINQNYKCT